MPSIYDLPDLRNDQMIAITFFEPGLEMRIEGQLEAVAENGAFLLSSSHFESTGRLWELTITSEAFGVERRRFKVLIPGTTFFITEASWFGLKAHRYFRHFCEAIE